MAGRNLKTSARISMISLLAILLLMMFSSPILMAQYPWYQQRWRPLLGGIQIQFNHGGNCSIGFSVYYDTGLIYRQRIFGVVSAGHCGFWNTGWLVYQPAIDPNNYIGSVTMNNGIPRPSDSLFVQTEVRGYWFWERPPKPESVAPYILLLPGMTRPVYGAVREDEWRPWMLIDKVGITTGVTIGYLIDIWRSPINTADSYMLLATYESASGDSGAPVSVVIPEERLGGRNLLGVHSGRVILYGTDFAFFSPVWFVMRELGISPLTIYDY